MNNLVFNNVSSQLRTVITNATVTVSGSVDITNTTLTVTGSVDITNTTLTVTGSVDITNTTLTVTGSVDITNDTLTITGDINIDGHSITNLNASFTDVTSTGLIFADTDTSEITTGSFYVYNTGSNPITVSLQMSPLTTPTFYILDPDNDNLTVTNGTNMIIPLSKYGHYARLLYDAGATIASFSAYYVGQM